ncbi:class I SAM-dependent methyltransferase [Thalassospira sp. GO-4]|jgi:ubiquinone/menaquinone biosynthesis C-methylase UbiE|uniref:class I SAM-dependent methyltransferase n=1 Tax=Thalassospira sp. GO-4 TaxID=2946605 RepID=UPI0020247811|nr:class I SAM-dependent methyltransferase [Thalassospira sp. GO-4]URK16783.1 class I SAM-dependent methyltransferase [Thalassospira sp. GO-4]
MLSISMQGLHNIVRMKLLHLHKGNNEALGTRRTQQFAKWFNGLLVSRSEKQKRTENIPVASQHQLQVVSNLTSEGWSTDIDLSEISGPLVSICSKISDNRAELLASKKTGKRFMQNLLTDTDFEEHPELLEFVLSEEVLSIASNYMGFVPVLSSCKLLISGPDPEGSKELKSSQLLHCDTADTPFNHLKLIVHINDIGLDNGPFSFLDARSSSQLSQAIDYAEKGVDYRVPDELAYRHIDSENLLKSVGPSSHTMFIDTSRCFHQGSRNIKNPRILLMVQFVSPSHAAFIKLQDFKIRDLSKFSEIQCLALRKNTMTTDKQQNTDSRDLLNTALGEIAPHSEGERYSEYYERRMDVYAETVPGTFHDVERTFQLDYLKRKGLMPNNSLFDYGCGPLGAGIHFIEYLENNNYVGADISSKFLKLGMKKLDELRLSSKNVELHHCSAGDLSALPDRKFDYIWAQSVLTHMPAEDVEYLYSQISRFMHSETVFFASINFLTDEYEERDVIRENIKNWIFSKSYFENLGKKLGFDMEILEDFHHPDELIKANRKLAIVRCKLSAQ